MVKKPNGLEVHPVAALFPMIPDEELQDMADSIKAIGLLHPLVTDASGKVLLEGRNRLAACKLAGVDPVFEPIAPGLDPVDFILAENINRRHMPAGARAMVVAVARNGKIGNPILAKEADVNRSTISQARVVRQFAPHLVSQVIDGGSLWEAYQKAVEAKQRLVDAEAEAKRAAQFAKTLPGKLEKEYGRFKLAIEEIGPAIPIRDQPDLEVGQTAANAAEREQATGSLELEAVKRQEAFVKRLNHVVRELRELAEFSPDAATGGWAPTLAVAAIRSAATHVVDSMYQIVENHNRAIDDGRLRVLPKDA